MNTTSDGKMTFSQKLAERAERAEQVLFENQWLTAEEARQQYRKLRLDSTVKVAELILFLMLILFGTAIPFAVLALLGGIVG